LIFGLPEGEGGIPLERNRDQVEKEYAEYRPLLFSIAYRMLGSVMDAEDIVQEAFLSWSESDREQVRNPKSYLSKMVTNRCIDRIRGAVREREAYVGPWLPVPLVTEQAEGNGPEERALRKESLSTAYMLLLQQLSWAERTVFILREALGYEYDEIAEIVGKSSANCRQIFSRARKAASGLSPTAEPAATGWTETLRPKVERFVAALVGDDPSGLIGLLKAEANLYSDGGGKVTAAIRPIRGAERVAAFLYGIKGKVPHDFSFRIAEVNGQPGILMFGDGRPYGAVTFRFEGNAIAEIYLVVNPDKLEHLRAEEGK